MFQHISRVAGAGLLTLNTGGPGYNAALAIHRDLGLDVWWDPPDLEQLWGAEVVAETSAT